jgi:hypothetical protein
LPVVLFVIVYVSKHKNYQAKQATPDTDKLVTDGYEFVIIEAVANLSVFFRLCSDDTNHFPEYAKTILILGAVAGTSCMGVLFFYGWAKYGRAIAKEVTDFQYTFYFCFLSWWSRIVILGIYSGFFSLNYIFILIVLLLFGGSLFIFKRFINKYFIKWTDLFRELTTLISVGRSTKAIKKGNEIMNRFYEKEGEDYVMALAETSAELGTMYYLQQNPHQKRLATVIRYLENFLTHPQSAQLDKRMHALILAGISCKKGDKRNAIRIIKEYLPEELHALYIDYINNNQCSQIVSIDR